MFKIFVYNWTYEICEVAGQNNKNTHIRQIKCLKYLNENGCNNNSQQLLNVLCNNNKFYILYKMKYIDVITQYNEEMIGDISTRVHLIDYNKFPHIFYNIVDKLEIEQIKDIMNEIYGVNKRIYYRICIE